VQGCLTHGSLLEIPVTIGETTYTAVVDSGSEVNIIRSDIYQNDVRIPIVSEVDMSLHDTNSGNNCLLGLVPDLEMKVGALRTWGSVWVSEMCSPAILLGRPWQRENMVSIDERSTGTYLQFSEAKDTENCTTPMEILVKPYNPKKGKYDQSQNPARHCLVPPTAYLGMAAGADTSILPNLDARLTSVTDLGAQERAPHVFKRDNTEEVDTWGTMSEPFTLENAYYQLFQLEPTLENYGKSPPMLPNGWLRILTSPIHTPSGNRSTDFLALNSAQFAMRHNVTGRVDDHFRIMQIIHMELPPVGALIDKRRISLLTVLLCNDGRKITSPIPYALFTRIGNSNTPFLPAYHVYHKQML
jgi:hypothetical protein